MTELDTVLTAPGRTGLPAARRTPRPGTAVVAGRPAVSAVLTGYAELAARCALPATARAPWVRAALAAEAPTAAWAVLVHDATGGLRAAALLADRWDGGQRRAVLLTGGDGYRAALAALDDGAAAELGRALAAAADARGCDLDLTGLPGGDGLVLATARAAGAHVHPALPVPFVRRPDDGSALLSSNVRKTLRKARNRLAADGVDVRFDVVGDPAAISALLPELELAHRDRDEAHGLASVLDAPAGRALWAGRIEELAGAGDVELSTLELDGQLAAYVVGLRESTAYGIWEGRFRTRWSRYAPGRLLESVVLARALADPRVEVVDWMTGVAPETLLATSGTAQRVDVRRVRHVRRVP